jgi:hypothetical protein
MGKFQLIWNCLGGIFLVGVGFLLGNNFLWKDSPWGEEIFHEGGPDFLVLFKNYQKLN